MRAGVIIAGGRSTRFGEADKAVATLAGTPMIRRVADRVTRCVDTLVVNCRDDQVDRIDDALDSLQLPVSFQRDETPDLGPVGGMATGLRWVADHHKDASAFVIACDMPFVDPAIVRYLFDRRAGVDAAVPRLGDGWYQPTHAVYDPRAMADACDRAIERDRLRILEPLETLDVQTVTESELERIGSLESFENVNTQAELEAAADRLKSDSTE